MNTDAVASLVSRSVDVSTNLYDKRPNYLSQNTYLGTELTDHRRKQDVSNCQIHQKLVHTQRA